MMKMKGDGMPQSNSPASARDQDNLSAVRWCRYLVRACYVAIAVNLAVLIAVWYFFAFGHPGVDHASYWAKYIILPTLVMLGANLAADYLVRSRRFSVTAKEYVTLFLILILCAMVSLIHSIVAVLLASFIIPVLVSTIFSNLRMTTVIYALSQAFLILGAVNMRFFSARAFEHWIWMEALTASGLLAAAYLLARVLVQHGAASIMAISYFAHSNLSLEEKLNLDPLTGIYNRRAYDELLPRLMRESRLNRQPLTIVALDIDDFKQVNDIYGHSAGDRALLMLVELLRQEMPESSVLFRIGGDEFILVFKDYTAEEAFIVCRNLLSALRGACLPEAKGLELSFSCGIAGMSEALAQPESLFQAADAALYSAKNKGKKRIVMYEGQWRMPIPAQKTASD